MLPVRPQPARCVRPRPATTAPVTAPAAGACCDNVAAGRHGLHCSAELRPWPSVTGWRLCFELACTVGRRSVTTATSARSAPATLGPGRLCAQRASSPLAERVTRAWHPPRVLATAQALVQDICTFNPACPDDPGVPTTPSARSQLAIRLTAPAARPRPTMAAPATSLVQAPLTEPASAGVCSFAPDDCGTVGGTVQIGCTNGVTTAQSPFPNVLYRHGQRARLLGRAVHGGRQRHWRIPEVLLGCGTGHRPGRRSLRDRRGLQRDRGARSTEQAKSCSRLIPRASRRV